MSQHLKPPRLSQEQLASLIGQAHASRVRRIKEGKAKRSPVRNPLAIKEDGGYILIEEAATLTTHDLRERVFRCPNIRCKHATSDALARFSLSIGETKQPHFSHIDEVDHCRESMIHHWAAEIVGDAKVLTVPKIDGLMLEPVRGQGILRKVKCTGLGTDPSVTSLGVYHADAALQDQEGKILVEITYTHNTTRTKQAFYRAMNIRVLEIVLDDEAPFEIDQFIEHVLHLAPRRWISHPREIELQQKKAIAKQEKQERQKQQYQTAASVRPKSSPRDIRLYQLHRDTISTAHNLPKLRIDPLESNWFSLNPERAGQWRLDMVELLVLRQFRLRHHSDANRVIDPLAPWVWDALSPIITPEMVVFAGTMGPSDDLFDTRPADEVRETLIDVFGDMAGVAVLPQAGRVEFSRETMHSLGIAEVVLHHAGEIANHYGDASAAVLERWVRESDLMPTRNNKHPEGGNRYIPRLKELEYRLSILIQKVTIPNGTDPDDLVGFDDLAAHVDFTSIAPRHSSFSGSSSSETSHTIDIREAGNEKFPTIPAENGQVEDLLHKTSQTWRQNRSEPIRTIGQLTSRALGPRQLAPRLQDLPPFVLNPKDDEPELTHEECVKILHSLAMRHYMNFLDLARGYRSAHVPSLGMSRQEYATTRERLIEAIKCQEALPDISSPNTMISPKVQWHDFRFIRSSNR